MTAGNWNNIYGDGTGSANGSVSALVCSDGTSTSYSLAVTTAFGGVNVNGTGSPDASLSLPATATSDSFWGCSDIAYAGKSPSPAQLKLSGLNLNKTYKFTFFASRTGVSDNRETQYTVTGSTSETVYLDAANNTAATVSTGEIFPDGNGEIKIDLTAGPNNNNYYGFFYLGAMKVDFKDAAVFTLKLTTADAAIGDWQPDGNYVTQANGWGNNTAESIWGYDVEISGTDDDELYNVERFCFNNSSINYAVPVENGRYTVKLHFAEIYHSAVGRRVFNVDIEGSRMLENFDIVSQAGGRFIAIQKTFDVTVADDVLNIDFISVVDGPKITAIEIISK